MEAEILTEHDEIMVAIALQIFPSRHVEGSHFATFTIPGALEHTCSECAHYHRSFPPPADNHYPIGPDSTQEELEMAHRQVQLDRTRVVKAAVIDGIEKIGHKVRPHSI